MGDHVVILREANDRDIDRAVALIQAMLVDMVSCGGHPLAEEERVLSYLRSRFSKYIANDEHIFLLAGLERESEEPVGIIEASVVPLREVFQPKRVLHIHSIYVEPAVRRSGIGRILLQEALEWGNRKGCLEAELNTLFANPARRLFESQGFDIFQLEMRMSLNQSSRIE